MVVGLTRKGKGRIVTGAEAGAGAGGIVDEGNEAARIAIEKNHRRGILAAEAGVGQRVTDKMSANSGCDPMTSKSKYCLLCNT